MFYERKITKLGNPANLNAPKKYVDMRAYVVVLKKLPARGLCHNATLGITSKYHLAIFALGI